MLIEKDHDLGLSLGLTSSESRRSIQLNLMLSSSPPPTMLHSNPCWISDFRSQSGRRTVQASQAIDVNRAPVSEIENEDDAAASSPNSTVSTESSGAKRRYDASGGDEMEGDEEDGDGSRKKLRLSKEQGVVLEESFKENNTLNPKQKLALANKLNLRPRQVEVWFQNRRARTKLKQTEVDCELLKLCCENLTEENRRLQKEVQELRSLKLPPQFYMHMTPPTTLTMCPSCQRIAVSNPAAPPPPPPRVDTNPLFPRQIRPPPPSRPAWAPIMIQESFLHAAAKPHRS